jgi:hypothetical protein
MSSSAVSAAEEDEPVRDDLDRGQNSDNLDQSEALPRKFILCFEKKKRKFIQ